MKIIALTLLILQINRLIDSRKHDDISIADVHQAIESRSLLRMVKERAGTDVDLSMHMSEAYGGFEAYFEQKMVEFYEVYAGQERRKWGIENSGLCLILAWTNEIIQNGEGLTW